MVRKRTVLIYIIVFLALYTLGIGMELATMEHERISAVLLNVIILRKERFWNSHMGMKTTGGVVPISNETLHQDIKWD